MGLVHLSGVAALFQRFLRQCCGRSRTSNQHGVRLGRYQLQGLAGDGRVAARKPFVSHNGQALERCRLGKLLRPAFAVSIRKTDKTDCLHAQFRHVLGNGQRHHDVVLRCFENPLFLRVYRLNDARRRRHGNHRRLCFSDDVDHGQRVGRDGRAENDVDLALGDQLAGVGNRSRGVRRIIKDDVVDLVAANRFGHHGDGVFFWNAQRGCRASGRNGHPDVHVGMRQSGDQKAGEAGHQLG